MSVNKITPLQNKQSGEAEDDGRYEYLVYAFTS